MPFSAYALMPGDTGKQLGRLIPDLVFLETHQDAFDICLKETNKAVGLGWVLKRLSIDWSEVVAVGDSANDIDMLCAAAVGVVMGNAPQDIKSIADYVTGTVMEDGLLEPIRLFF